MKKKDEILGVLCLDFIFVDEKYRSGYTCYMFFINSYFDGHLDWFHTLCILNSGTVDVECPSEYVLLLLVNE